ncbi:hypothetical protein LSAT2_022991, partial [Lamellibrachia satsuma]
DGDICLHLFGRIRYLKSLWPDVELICMLWSQCEADTVPPFRHGAPLQTRCPPSDTVPPSLAYTMVLSTPWPSRWSYPHHGHHGGLVDTLAITVVLSTPWRSRWSCRQPGHHGGLIHTMAIT